jgi:hypothetical protein
MSKSEAVGFENSVARSEPPNVQRDRGNEPYAGRLANDRAWSCLMASLMANIRKWLGLGTKS